MKKYFLFFLKKAASTPCPGHLIICTDLQEDMLRGSPCSPECWLYPQPAGGVFVSFIPFLVLELSCACIALLFFYNIYLQPTKGKSKKKNL